MSQRTRTISRLSVHLALPLAIAAWSLAAVPNASAGLSSAGPVLTVGFASKNGTDLVLPAVGWRLRSGLGQGAEDLFSRMGMTPSLVLEPSLAAITGDADSIEAQLLPLLHLTANNRSEEQWSVYAELGIGLSYTAVHGLRLGSELLFSDVGGIGITLPSWNTHRFGLGYRFRHQSHAGFWAKTNSGLNTHFLVLTVE